MAENKIFMVNGVSFEMVFVEGGEMLMGKDDGSYSLDVHRVILSNYYMSKLPVTNEL